MTEDGVATSYTYDAANRLLSSTTGDTVKAYTYDTNGNRETLTYTDGVSQTHIF